ncbi:hypothetical protein ISN45_Aa01g020530 [Arabidopsis thaliana x Arabidopsis arenosa]|uniref:Uncharacterized protein n=1 Tax=Arabidopsis thaliana x Arabidopsis arenosa TaxID=1240361 RepID=A0A8T2C1X4_9BRAS|nr:hypothetical protein ISN45_Aa01g020530 [Arabidopsis thaliana x Arabidopsis arenosa]
METTAETISGGVPNNTMKLLFVEMGVGYDQHGGEIVNVEVVDGGLICSSGVLVEEMGDKNEDCYIVNVAVYRKMKGNKKISSIFENRHVSASQEVYLQRCGFAVPGQPPPDSDPSVGVSPLPLNEGIASQLSSDDSETDSVIGSGHDAVESQAIRLVSPEESVDTVDLEEDVADRTVEVLAEDKQSDVPLESENRRDERLESAAKEDRGKKLKIPLRDVVKAIVMNSKNTEEEEEADKEIKKMSCVQILLQKGFKF